MVPEGIAGHIARVEKASTSEQMCVVRFLNGNEVALSADCDFEPGTVVLVQDVAGGVRIFAAPEDLWEEPRQTGRLLSTSETDCTVALGERLIVVPLGRAVSEWVGEWVAFDRVSGVVGAVPAPSSTFNFSLGGNQDRDADDVTGAGRFRVKLDAKRYSYDTFRGLDDVLGRARDLVELPLTQAPSFSRLGRHPVRGVLFSGPPGTGKTQLARVIAANADASLFAITGPTIFGSLYGESSRLMKSIFDEARVSDGAAIIFIDEVDAIAGRRGPNSHPEDNRVVAQLLTAMDGFEPQDNVIVIAATNRPEELDPALLRPGRLDWEIRFRLPDREGRLAILGGVAKKVASRGDLDLEHLADRTDSWSPAELGLLWDEASLLAVRDRRDYFIASDLVGAREVVAPAVLASRERENARDALRKLHKGETP